MVVNPFTFKMSAIRRRFISASSMTDVLIPITMVLGAIRPGASSRSKSHAVSVDFSYVFTSIFFILFKEFRVMVIGRVRVSSTHLDVVLGCELHLSHQRLLLRVGYDNYRLVHHDISRLVSLESYHVVTYSDTLSWLHRHHRLEVLLGLNRDHFQVRLNLIILRHLKF
jgi:hypothetical protein